MDWTGAICAAYIVPIGHVTHNLYIILAYYFFREAAISSNIPLYILLSLFPNPLLYTAFP